MSKTLQIEVQGTVGSGKTTLVALIQGLLEKEGLHCSISPEETEEMKIGYFEKRKEAIKNINICISSRQLHKRSLRGEGYEINTGKRNPWLR